MRGLIRRAPLVALLLGAAACSRNAPPDLEPDPRFDPIPVHVRNDNFLDVNVFVVAGGMSRRLGQVTGNSEADFSIAWSVASGQSVALMATPIGGRGSAYSGALTVGPGQMIDFRIGSVLRQSMATVRAP
jgi:hypothetical protein